MKAKAGEVAKDTLFGGGLLDGRHEGERRAKAAGLSPAKGGFSPHNNPNYGRTRVSFDLSNDRRGGYGARDTNNNFYNDPPRDHQPSLFDGRDETGQMHHTGTVFDRRDDTQYGNTGFGANQYSAH